MSGHGIANFERGFFLFRTVEPRRQPAHRLQNIDGWIVPRRAQIARKNDMTVQDRPHGIANRLVKVVALHQHGEEARNGALAEAAGAVEDFWKEIEDSGRVALLARWLAGCQK